VILAGVLMASVLLSACATLSPKGSLYGPQAPAFARFALTDDSSKLLAVKFEESGGRRQAYDVLHVGADLTGNLEGARVVKGRVLRSDRSFYCTFPIVNFDVPAGEPGSDSDSWAFMFTTVNSPAASTFRAEVHVSLDRDSSTWKYTFYDQIARADSLEAAPLWRFKHVPRLQIQTKPDPQEPGQLGIALNLLVGENGALTVEGDNRAHLEIRGTDGEVVHEVTDRVEKFAFG
jgi:hypothetical protein